MTRLLSIFTEVGYMLLSGQSNNPLAKGVNRTASRIHRLSLNVHMQRTCFYPFLLVLTGLALDACVSAEPTFQPAVTIVLAPDAPSAVSSEYMEATRLVVQERLDAVFAASSRVTVDGSYLKVELSSSENAALAGNLATEIGIIEFWRSPTPVEPDTAVPSDLVPVMNGLDISEARAERDRAGNTWQVVVQFTPSGTEKLAQFTASKVGQYLVISRDRQVVSAPYVKEPITGGQAVIAGAYTEIIAKSLAAVLNSGALPVPLKIVSVN